MPNIATISSLEETEGEIRTKPEAANGSKTSRIEKAELTQVISQSPAPVKADSFLIPPPWRAAFSPF